MAWDLQVVIPSKGRPEGIPTLRLFNDPILCVGEPEEDLYRAFNPSARLLVHPVERGVTTLSWVRQFILDHVDAHVVFMCDDDVKSFACLVGQKIRRFQNPDDTEQVLINTATCAEEAETTLFAFAHTIDVRNFRPFAPISFTGYANGFASGFIGKAFKFDTALATKSDIDLTLQILRDKRILWRDMRFAFESSNFFKRLGGLAEMRDTSVIARDVATLKRRWGVAVDIDHHTRHSVKHQSVHINVSR